MDYIIDRFEGNFAVCQNMKNESIVNIEKSLIVGNAKEGDVITLDNGKYFFDEKKTSERRNLIKAKFDSLWK